MGLCWSDPPVQQKQASVKPSAPPAQTYTPPFQQQYTYAVKPQQVYYPYSQQQYLQQYPYAQYYQQGQMQPYALQPYPPRSNGIGTATAVVGGMVVGSVLENMMDPV